MCYSGVEKKPSFWEAMVFLIFTNKTFVNVFLNSLKVPKHTVISHESMHLSSRSCQRLNLVRSPFVTKSLLTVSALYFCCPTKTQTGPIHHFISVLTHKKETRFPCHIFDYYKLDKDLKMEINAQVKVVATFTCYMQMSGY